MRTNAKIDRNQPEIVLALRALGCTVTSLAAVGGGVPDLLVGYRGVNILIEVKDGDAIPSKRKLTTDQVDYHAMWKGTIHVVKLVDEAINLINQYND